MSEENNEAIKAAFDAAIADGKDADEVKVEMIKAGCQVKDTGRLYREGAIDSGIMMDTKARTAKIDDILSGVDGLDTEDGLTDAIDALVDGVPATSEKSAAALIRGWGKKNEVDIFKRTRGTGTGGTRAFIFRLTDALVENPSMNEDTFNEMLSNEGKSSQKYGSHFNSIRVLANKLAA